MMIAAVGILVSIKDVDYRNDEKGHGEEFEYPCRNVGASIGRQKIICIENERIFLR